MSQQECNVYRHAWYPVPGDWTPPFEGRIETLRCERCGSERREIWQPNSGALLYRRYARTEGWVSYKRDERPSMDDFRLDLIRREIGAARSRRRQLKAVDSA